MGVCPVCGCKTDDLDFVAHKFGDSEEKICSFCEKQLKAFEGGEVSKAHIRWLGSVCEKKPSERSEAAEKSLAALAAKYQAQIGETVPKSAQNNTSAAAGIQSPAGRKVQQYAFPSDEAHRQSSAAANDTAALEARIAALEKKVDKMKKAQLIRNALEIILPIMLFLLIILVFFASGTYDKFKDLFKFVTENMAAVPNIFINFNLR